MKPPRTSVTALLSVRADRDLEELRRKLTDAVRRVCPAWLSSDREDIVQTALIRVARIAAEKIEPFGRSYLWKAAYSATVDEVRRRWDDDRHLIRGRARSSCRTHSG